jgi:hypothetical protein
VNITRLATPISVITIVNPAGNPDLCINGNVKLRGNGSSAVPLGYQWILNGSDLVGSTDRVYNATVTGTYKVRVTNLTTGCSTLSAPVSVFSSCKTTADSKIAPEMNMYPNPTDGHFVINLEMNADITGNAVVQIFNNLGQTVFGESVPVIDGVMTKEIWLGEKDAAGMYFVRVIMNDQVFNGQVIYQK